VAIVVLRVSHNATLAREFASTCPDSSTGAAALPACTEHDIATEDYVIAHGCATQAEATSTALDLAYRAAVAGVAEIASRSEGQDRPLPWIPEKSCFRR
jgi:hypothetical protein